METRQNHRKCETTTAHLFQHVVGRFGWLASWISNKTAPFADSLNSVDLWRSDIMLSSYKWHFEHQLQWLRKHFRVRTALTACNPCKQIFAAELSSRVMLLGIYDNERNIQFHKLLILHFFPWRKIMNRCFYRDWRFFNNSKVAARGKSLHTQITQLNLFFFVVLS